MSVHKDKNYVSKIAGGALLLALTLIFQSIRMVVPLPPVVGVFIIGILVNAALALGTYRLGVRIALAVSLVLPPIAYLQGQLPLPVFIPLIVLGNAVYILAIAFLRRYGAAIFLAALLKAAVIYGSTLVVLSIFAVPDSIKQNVVVIFGIAQLFTGIVGLILAGIANKVLEKK